MQWLWRVLYANNPKRREQGRNKDHDKKDGGNVFEDDGKEALCLEGGGCLDFIDNGFGLYDKADQDTSQKGHDGHKDAVADEIKQIKELHTENFDLAQDAIAERRGKPHQKRTDKDDKASDLSIDLQLILDHRHDRLSQRDRGGQGCKGDQQEEQGADDLAAEHGPEDLGQRDEHERGAGGKCAFVTAGKGKDGRDDHQP